MEDFLLALEGLKDYQSAGILHHYRIPAEGVEQPEGPIPIPLASGMIVRTESNEQNEEAKRTTGEATSRSLIVTTKNNMTLKLPSKSSSLTKDLPLAIAAFKKISKKLPNGIFGAQLSQIFSNLIYILAGLLLAAGGKELLSSFLTDDEDTLTGTIMTIMGVGIAGCNYLSLKSKNHTMQALVFESNLLDQEDRDSLTNFISFGSDHRVTIEILQSTINDFSRILQDIQAGFYPDYSRALGLLSSQNTVVTATSITTTNTAYSQTSDSVIMNRTSADQKKKKDQMSPGPNSFLEEQARQRQLLIPSPMLSDNHEEQEDQDDLEAAIERHYQQLI